MVRSKTVHWTAGARRPGDTTRHPRIRRASSCTGAAAVVHPALGPDSVDIGTMERGLIEPALTKSKGNKSKAARLLGLTRAQLYARLDKYDLR
jgi:transcriptional regulator with PAS, ATPase and Fis domain